MNWIGRVSLVVDVPSIIMSVAFRAFRALHREYARLPQGSLAVLRSLT